MKHLSLSALAVGALALVAAGPGQAQAQQEWSFEGNELLVTNMIGEVTVRGHGGSRIVVRARAAGDDAEKLDFEVRRDGRAEFHVVYPLDESQRYAYPRMQRGRTRFYLKDWTQSSSLLADIYSALTDRDWIEVRGAGGRGLEVWADLEILVPTGVASRIQLAVGEIEARDVEADIDLDTHSGPVSAENIRGDTRIDTGSGSVVANSIRGSLDVDTGSGKVEVADVEGDVIRIDSGSGGVTVDGARSRRLDIDTGSGSVQTSDIEADNTVIDTGSGSVTLDLVRLSGGTHAIDTGSGGVTVKLPADASVRIHAETGSGGIDLDVPNAKLRRMSRDEIDLEIGEGQASLQIETGSGGVKIRSR